MLAETKLTGHRRMQAETKLTGRKQSLPVAGLSLACSNKTYREDTKLTEKWLLTATNLKGSIHWHTDLY